MCTGLTCVRVYRWKCFSAFCLKCVHTCKNQGPCMHDNKHTSVCACLSRVSDCLSGLRPLSPQAWPTSFYTVELILCECAQPVVATVDPLMRSPTLTQQEGNGQPVQFLPQRPIWRVIYLDETWAGFSAGWTLLRNRPEQVFLIDHSNVKKHLAAFLQKVLRPSLTRLAYKPHFKCTRSDTGAKLLGLSVRVLDLNLRQNWYMMYEHIFNFSVMPDFIFSPKLTSTCVEQPTA